MRIHHLLCVLLPAVALAQAPAPAPGAPSDEPVPTESPVAPAPAAAGTPVAGASTAAAAADAPATFKGFDLRLTVFSSSGVFFGAEGYTNTLTLWFEPSYALGKQLFAGKFLEPLTVGLRLPLEVELAGTDPRFRGPSFSSSALFGSPEQAVLASAAAQNRQIDGTEHRPVVVGDTWLSVSDPKLFVIPRVGIEVGAGARFVLPTSASSRNAGLVTAASLGVFADKQLGPVNLSYAARPTKYFFTRAVPEIHGTSETVLVNGKQETLWRPPSTGVPNPSWGVVHGASVEVELPRHFALSLNYYLLHTAPYRPSQCLVDGTPGADVCRDGPLVGDVRGDAMRVDQWFLASADWRAAFATFSLGVSTFRPLVDPDGKVAQPFFVSNRNNYTTLYLSMVVSAEQLAQAVSGKGHTP